LVDSNCFIAHQGFKSKIYSSLQPTPPSYVGFVCWDCKLHNLDELGRVVVMVLLVMSLLQLLGCFLQIGFKLWLEKALALRS